MKIYHLSAAEACASLQSLPSSLAEIVVMQVANVFLCRSDRRSPASSGVRGNKLILAGIAVEIGLIFSIVYTPWGNTLLGTSPLPLAVWLFVLPFFPAMLLLEETRKWIVRRGAAERKRNAWAVAAIAK